MGAVRYAVKQVAGAVDRVNPPASGLVVLLYHRVGATTPVSVDLPVGLFDDQMAMVAETTRPVTLDQAVGLLATGGPVTGRVVVSFDDGTADLVDHALPVLVKHRVPAIVYVATEFVDSGRSFPDAGRPVTWAGLAEAVDTGLVTVGSHTHTHALLDRLPAAVVASELDRSVDLIEDRLSTAAAHFAYPKARRPTRAADREVRARFRSAAVAGTKANPAGTDPYLLARSPVQVGDGLHWFERKLRGGLRLEDDLRRMVNRARHAGATS